MKEVNMVKHFYVSLIIFFIIFIFLIPFKAQSESLLVKILRVTGISANPTQQRGPGDYKESGDIWIVNRSTKKMTRITTDGGYRSPVFVPNDSHVMALKGKDVVMISLSGEEVRAFHPEQNVIKIIGFDSQDNDSALTLLEDDDGRTLVGFISLASGQITYVPFDRKVKADREMLIHLKQWTRVYGTTMIYVKNEINQSVTGLHEFTNVYIKEGDTDAVKLTDCKGNNCGQPSLSHNKNQVVFIKSNDR
jgi:hypothetical protein